MARVHTLLSQNHWEGIDFAELVRHQLAPDGTDANTIIDGPKVMLTVEATQVLAMVLHELVTNAAKYGALSTPHGRVEVEWNREDAANLLIAWREIGGPAVARRQHYSQSHFARARRFGRPCIRIRRRLL
jgi:two-component sensor histidine kinase